MAARWGHLSYRPLLSPDRQTVNYWCFKTSQRLFSLVRAVNVPLYGQIDVHKASFSSSSWHHHHQFLCNCFRGAFSAFLSSSFSKSSFATCAPSHTHHRSLKTRGGVLSVKADSVCVCVLQSVKYKTSMCSYAFLSCCFSVKLPALLLFFCFKMMLFYCHTAYLGANLYL